MLTLIETETQPFRKVHRLIDTFETILKTYTAVIIGTLLKEVDIPDKLKDLLVKDLEKPSLGTWQSINRETVDALVKHNIPCVIDSFYQAFDEFDRQYCKNSNDKEGLVNFISFRNSYAHGATPPDDNCTGDFEKYLPKLYEILEAEWFNETAIVSFKKPGLDDHVIIDGFQCVSDALNSKGFNTYNSGENNGVKPLYPYLVTAKGEIISLFPIITLTEDRSSESGYSVTFFNDLRKKNSISLLNYPSSEHISDKKLYSEFLSVVPLDEWKKSRSVSLFRGRVEELTEIFKGREAERKRIHDFVINEERGFLAVTGNPGIGKSALIAQSFRELSELNVEKKYHLIEYFVRRGTSHAGPDSMIGYLNRKIEDAFKTRIPAGADLQNNTQGFMNVYPLFQKSSMKVK
jgi:hypothetical protein